MTIRPSSRRSAFHQFAVLMSLALSAATAQAVGAAKESDTPADYAFSLPIQLTGRQGVVGFKLPQAVYLNAKSARLDDVRIFDAQGKPQAFSIQRPRAEIRTQFALRNASIFPIRSQGRPSPSAGGVELDIRTGADGRVISVRTHDDPPGGPGASASAVSKPPISGLILDFGAPDLTTDNAGERIAALRFAAPPDTPNYTAEIWLEISKDLKTWETSGAAGLAWLTNDDAQTLASDRLDITPFNPRTHRYARLTWRRGEAIVFPMIQAEYVSLQPEETERETLWIKPATGKIGDDLAYPAAVALPVDQVSFRLSEPNVVFPMALGRYIERPTRVTGKKTELGFQALLRTTVHQIEQDGQSRRSQPLPIPLTQLPEWVIRPQNATATAKPELGLSWQPDTLVFLAGGTPPYRLSFGRENTKPGNQPLAQVAPGFSADELKRLETAQLGELQKTSGSATGETAAKLADKEARNRRYALWGLLIIGVLILAAMSWHLIRQMKGKQPGTDKPDA